MRNSKRQRVKRKHVVRWNNLFVNKRVFYADTDSVVHDGQASTEVEIRALIGVTSNGYRTSSRGCYRVDTEYVSAYPKGL
jgi:hypothetical protein